MSTKQSGTIAGQADPRRRQSDYRGSAVFNRFDASCIRAVVVVVAAAEVVIGAIVASPPAIADDPLSLFMFNCGHVPTATPQLCKDTWDMVRNNRCRSAVVEYLDRRGVAFGDDRQMFNYATEIQRGDVPLDVC